MSKPRTPFAEVEASLDNTKRAWIKRMLAALGKSQPATSASGAAFAQPVNAAGPLLRGGLPIGPYEDMLEQQRRAGIDLKPSAEKAVKNAEAKRQANEANKQAPKEDKPWSFEDAVKNKYDDLPPVFQFPTDKPPTLGPDESLSVRDNDYEKLPKDLKSKMSPEVWKTIKGQRAKLFTIYMRLREYGAWDAVSAVTGIKEQLPPHGKLGAVEFGIYGTGGVAFEEKKLGGVAAILVNTGHFGQDNKIMALWHTGQKSYREWRKEQITPAGVLDESIHEWGQKVPPPPSSMHISMGPGTLFDAHIDRISPVNKPIDGQSVPNTDAGEHLGTEAIGPTIYGVTPAVTVNKEKDASHGMNVTAWINYRLEWDILSGDTSTTKKKKVRNPHPPQFEPLPEDLRTKITAQARKVSQKFPRTSDGDIDPGILAEFIAGSVLAAAKKRKTTITVNFPNYSDTQLSDAEQKVVHDNVQEIGKIVTSELGQKAAGVKNVTVYLPAQKALNVPLKK
jgi:hypothetical protein